MRGNGGYVPRPFKELGGWGGGKKEGWGHWGICTPVFRGARGMGETMGAKVPRAVGGEDGGMDRSR